MITSDDILEEYFPDSGHGHSPDEEIFNMAGEIAYLRNAIIEFVDDLRSRYPGEEFHCPYVIALDKATTPRK